MRTVLDACNPKRRARQVLPGVRVVLDHLNGGLGRIRKHELRGLIGVQLNDARGIVDEVMIRALQLRHDIRAGREQREIDLAVLVGSELGRAVIARDGLDAEFDVRDYLVEVAGVHLDEVDARFLAVVKQQLTHTVAGFELDLLRRGVGNVPVVRLNLFDEVGAGFYVVHQNHALGVGLVDAKAHAVAPDLERDVRHGL